MIEIERVYLAKFLPADLDQYEKKEIIDIYIPRSDGHAAIRVRKNGDKYEITKKTRINEDSSQLKEETIEMIKEEFEIFSTVQGQRVHKIRYYYKQGEHTAEIDVFQGALKGLVAVEVEFTTLTTKDDFQMPEFCLVDITHNRFIAGGIICGKRYEDVEAQLTSEIPVSFFSHM